VLRTESNGLVYYRFESLGSVPHGVFTRLGGISREPWASLNVGHGVGDDPQAVGTNHDRLCAALAITRGNIATAYQVHSSHVGVVGPDDRGRVFSATDALMTNTPGVFLMLRFADCLPILLFDPVRRAVGIVHAGWRGTVTGVASAAVVAMREAFGTQPGDLIAGLGPAIGPCCYEVGENVAEQVRSHLPNGASLLHRMQGGSLHFDLPEANRQQLEAMGVERIEMSGLCTACHIEEWFSHRGERGRTGRFGVIIGLSAHGHRS
jgi:YfiH family protein